jgi:hypothetical protein
MDGIYKILLVDLTMLKCREYGYLHLEIYLFVYFMVQILFHKSNNIQSVLLFKILNNVTVCILLNLKYLI